MPIQVKIERVQINSEQTHAFQGAEVATAPPLQHNGAARGGAHDPPTLPEPPR